MLVNVGSCELERLRVRAERANTLEHSSPYPVLDGQNLGLHRLVEAVADRRNVRKSRAFRSYGLTLVELFGARKDGEVRHTGAGDSGGAGSERE